MADNFLNAVNDELARLEEALLENVIFVRWRELRRVRDLYQLPNQDRALGVRMADPATLSIGRPSSRRMAPERERALLLVRSLLRGRPFSTPTRDILAFLEDSGVLIPGKDPVSNLSAMLSNSEEFTSHGRSGWTYDPNDEEDDDEQSIEAIMNGPWHET